MSRRRRWLLALLGVFLLGLVLLFAGVQWLLHSESGRDFALARAQSQLDALGIEYASLEGTIGGPLTLREVRMDIAGTRVGAQELRIDLAPTALLTRRVHVESLRGRGIDVTLAAPTEEAPASDEPFALPDLRLPVAIAIDDALLEDIVVHPAPLAGEAPAEPLRIQRLAFAADLDRSGALQVPRLALESDAGRVEGRMRIAFDGGRNGEAQLRIAGPAADAPVAELDLRGAGDAAQLGLALPGGDRLQLRLDGTRWQLDSALTAVDPSPWWPAWEHGEFTVQLQGAGEGRSGTVAGELAFAGEHWRIGRSTLSLAADNASLTADPLLLTRLLEGEPGGSVRLQGRLGLSADAASDLRAELAQVQLPGTGGAILDGALVASGTAAGYALTFDGQLQRDAIVLPVTLRGHGGADAMQVEHLAIQEDGRDALAASGRVQWTPQPALALDLQLDRFDPGRLLPEWPGALSGAARVEAARADQDWTAVLQLEALHGELRGQRFAGNGVLHWGGGEARSDLLVRIGDGRIRVQGSAGEQLDLDVVVEQLVLADVLPDAEGRVDGSVQVDGSREAPRVALSLRAADLLLAGQRAGSLAAEGTLGVAADAPFDLHVDATALVLGGLEFSSAQVTLEGTAAAHQATATLQGERLDVELALQGARNGDDWRGRIDRLALAPGESGPWSLRAPTELALVGGQWTLGQACMEGPEGTLCAQASAADGAQHAELELARMPLSTFSPLLSAGQPVPWTLSGEVSARAQLDRAADGTLQVDARVQLPEGSIALALGEQPQDARELLQWRELQVQVQVRGDALQASAEGTLEQSGRLALQLQGGVPGQPQAALSGQLQLQLPDLRVLELLTPHVADPAGRLDADLRLGGSWDDPRLDGRVEVTELAGELPALGIALRDSQLLAQPAGDGSLQLSGQLDSGEGVLALAGRLARGEQGIAATATLSGERVLVSDTPLARALVSPQLELAYASADGLRIDGSVAVPEARLDLEQLEGSIEPSDDVVVLDPRDDREQGGDMPVRADLELVLGEEVELQGFGFDGQVSGSIRVRERAGRVTTARGTLDVTGEYTAYGQDLEILQGRLLYSATPLDNPALDVRAQREIREQTVGLRIRGSARTPELEIYAEPPLEQAEALSYLVLGRPLNAATSADSGQLSQAAAAIGGNFLAAKLGARLGFDTFEVGDSSALGGTAFTVGKYLSPKLYVSYGVALFGEGAVLTLRYILSRRFEVELESGVENRVGVNYTLER